MKCNYGFTILGLVILVLLNEPVMSSWDFAVTTKGQINFYGSDWSQITSAAHQFDELSAITFDESEETVYFNDQSNNNGTIFALKLSLDDNHRVERVVQKTKDELIQGIAFDPLERVLYWTDARNKIIYQLAVDKNEEPSILIKLDQTKIPHGIAVDVCRRKLYWTNANHRNPTIERCSLDGSKYEVIINDGLFMPMGITVDQYTKRIYWVDDLAGNHYSVESAALDGTQRNEVIKNLFNAPFNLATDKDNIYWTDLTHETIWGVDKNNTKLEQPRRVQNFTQRPKGIVSRNYLLSLQADNPECKNVVQKIRDTLLKSSTTDKTAATTTITTTTVTPAVPILPTVFCLNDGVVNPKTNTCICTKQFKGIHCELPLCHNYCIEGKCHITSTGYAQCTCHPGFEGDRCEKDVCSGFCLNGGRCALENEEPICRCAPSFSGRHCETMDTNELCDRFCNEEQIDGVDVNLPKLCGNCSIRNTTDHSAIPIVPNTGSTFNNLMGSCSDSAINKTAAVVSVGVVIALALVFIIVKSIRRVYKPLRPRIKKTYVVHKNVTPTPLTCRPTTEQCEITIENCCNMNICDTPCFDPKVLQQEAMRKEDKKTLLNNMDADLMY